MSSVSASSSSPLIAMGIVSPPEYLDRRVANRASWMRWPNVGPGRPIAVRFAVRASAAPPWLDRLLTLEHRAHGDIWRAPVTWNETRLRGPALSVAAWLAHAPLAFPAARFVAKLDDDAYFHALDLEAMLRSALRAAPSAERIYMGSISWFNWYPRIFERSGYGWSFTMAWGLGRPCRNVTVAEERCKHRGCGACIGPFPFVSGYLAIFSPVLALELATSAVAAADLARLRASASFVTRTGSEQVKVMEDIWLGSLLHRQPPSKPVTYVAIAEGNNQALVSDTWGLKSTRMAMVVHIKGKQLARFLAVDAFVRKAHCTPITTLKCEVGCKAFLLQREARLLRESPSFAEMWAPRLNSSVFCAGGQQAASYCRVTALPPPGCSRKVTDLMNLRTPSSKEEKARWDKIPVEQWPREAGGTDYLTEAVPEAARLLNESARLRREAGVPSGSGRPKPPVLKPKRRVHKG